MRLHHVQVSMPAGGEDLARRFYRDALGLQEVEKPASLAGRGGCWFRAHGVDGSTPAEIHLGEDAPFVPARRAHPALLVDSAAELEERAHVVASAGFEVSWAERDTLEGFVRFHGRDGFGNRVEVLAHRAAPAPASATGLAELTTRAGAVLLRRATTDDVPAVVALLADDQLGRERDGVHDDEELRPYLRAFAAIDADPAHLLLVAEVGGSVVATVQLSFLPGLARRGSLRAQVEAVRVDADHRSGGLGSALVTWAVEEARRRGCSLVQLTSDERRTDAHRFYERLGFTASHKGMKLHL